MGCVETITADRWPEQGEWLNERVEVCFHYDTTSKIRGVIVRDDREDPYRTLILLDDGRIVLATECQWTHAKVAWSLANRAVRAFAAEMERFAAAWPRA